MAAVIDNVVGVSDKLCKVAKDKVNSFCRLCLTDENVFISIFNFHDNKNIYGTLTLSDRITICGSVKVQKNDGLPSNICGSCYEQIDKTFYFKEQCKRSDFTLRKYFKNVEPQNEEEFTTIKDTVVKDFNDLKENSVADTNTNCKRDTILSNNLWINTDAEGCSDNSIDPFCETENDIINDLFQDSLQSTTIKLDNVNTYRESDNVTYKELRNSNSNNSDDDDDDDDDDDKNKKHTSKKKILNNKNNNNSDKKRTRKRLTTKKKSSLSLYICDLCSKICNSHSSLYYHKLKHSDYKPHKCSYCTKTFHQKCTLIKHERVHTGVRPYTCEKCGKSFNQDSNLKFHMTSHGGEKIFCCHICGKGFTLGHNLKEHLKIHNNYRERLYPCHLCDKSFYHRSHLTNHVNSHNGIKPYCCDKCGKTFVKNSYLKQHNRTHSGEKPFLCKICPKSFASSSNLNAHIRSHNRIIQNNKNKLSCKLCNINFINKTKLIAHINSFHDSVINSDNMDNNQEIKFLLNNNTNSNAVIKLTDSKYINCMSNNNNNNDNNTPTISIHVSQLHFPTFV
ncbi:uncharacterized protein LOC142332951 [Lycorma delicatula]|uniref:uncharacterized protein LOC142332951 n=1 Tax=Lycorma delicatula TaxID=130591 RepID=UPI003F516815